MLSFQKKTKKDTLQKMKRVQDLPYSEKVEGLFDCILRFFLMVSSRRFIRETWNKVNRISSRVVNGGGSQMVGRRSVIREVCLPTHETVGKAAMLRN